MWKAYVQTTVASEIMGERQGQTCVCVGSYLNRPNLMSPWNPQHPSFSSILPHRFRRGALPTEVPDDLPGGINQPACSTWGHLVCMRAAHVHGQTMQHSMCRAETLPASSSISCISSISTGAGKLQQRVWCPSLPASLRSHPVSTASLCVPVSVLNLI